jgi:hypothetical protein
VLPWIAFSDELSRPSIEVLLGNSHALSERAWRRLVQNPDAASGTFGDLNAEKTGTLVLAARTDRPHLTCRQRVRPNAVFALELRVDTNFSTPSRPMT